MPAPSSEDDVTVESVIAAQESPEPPETPPSNRKLIAFLISIMVAVVTFFIVAAAVPVSIVYALPITGVVWLFLGFLALCVHAYKRKAPMLTTVESLYERDPVTQQWQRTDGRRLPRFFVRYLAPRLLPNEYKIYWLSRKHLAHLVASGFWIPLSVVFGGSITALVLGTGFTVSLPQLSHLHIDPRHIHVNFSSVPTTTRAILPSSASTVHIQFHPHHFSVPWWIWILAWIAAVILAYVLAYGWLYTFIMISDIDLALIEVSPRPLVWRNPVPDRFGIEKVQGVKVLKGSGIANLLNFGAVTSDVNVTDAGTAVFDNLRAIPHYQEFAAKLSVLSTNARQAHPQS